MQKSVDSGTFPVKQRVLTVLIPTYNGEASVARALTSVINDIETNNLSRLVDIIVMDNCSTDRTYQIASDLAAGKNWIEVYRSPENLGLDSNLQIGMTKSRSLYTKILCDDDVFVLGFLSNLLETIASNNNVDLIINNMADLNELIDGNLEKKNFSKLFLSNGDVRYLEITGGAYGHLSTLCFKTDSWSLTNESPILNDYVWNGMEFLGRAYHLTLYGACVWDESRLLLNDSGPKRWKKSHLDVFLVNASHALFIYNVSLLDKSVFPNSIGWDAWIRNARRGYSYHLILDFLSLKRINISWRDEAVHRFIPREFSATRFNRHFLSFLDYAPIWLCTLIVRLDYVTRRIMKK